MTDCIELDATYSTTRMVRRATREVVEEELKAKRSKDNKISTHLFRSTSSTLCEHGGLRTRGYFKRSSSEKPLVTIITVVFNGASHIEDTIASVVHQTYSNVEYLIIDGSSSDGTIDIVKKHERAIDYWVSEKDSGIYDAMNKGITLATGFYIGFINADDILIRDGLSRIMTAFDELSEPSYICAAVELITQSGKTTGSSVPLKENMRNRRRFLEMPCAHPGVFVDRVLYERLGFFDTSFKLSADYDFLLRLIDAGVPSLSIVSPVAKFRCGGASGGVGTRMETFLVLRKHKVNILVCVYVLLRSILKSGISKVLPLSLKIFINRLTTSKNRYGR